MTRLTTLNDYIAYDDSGLVAVSTLVELNG